MRMEARDFSGIESDGPPPNPEDVRMRVDSSDLIDEYVNERITI